MTVRNVALLLALMPPMTVARDARAQRREDTSNVCTGERWLPTHELRTREGYTVFMERLSIAPLRDNVFLAAWPTRTYDSLGKVVWPLAANGTPSSVEQVPLGVIVGNDGLARQVPWPKDIIDGPWLPIAASDAEGMAHVIWGSQDNVPSSSLYLVRALWYSRFDGARWTKPARILATEGTVMWNPAQMSPIVVHGHSLHLVVGVRGEGLRYLRSDGGVWTERHVNIPKVNMGYPHIAVLSSGRLVLMVQGNVNPSLAQAISGFYITRSDDAGDSWSPLTPITMVDEGPAFDARLLVDERDVLYAFWYQQTDEAGRPGQGVALGGSPGRIYATQSFDKGATWQRAMPTALIDNANELQVLMRPNHAVLAVVADGGGERMLISTWSDGWSPFTVIDAKPSPFNPSLGTDDAQRPFLTWGIRRSQEWLGTGTTTLVPCR